MSVIVVCVELVLPAGADDPAVRGAAAVATDHRQDGHREVSRRRNRGGPLRPGPAGRLPALHGHPPGVPTSAPVRGHRQRGHHDVHGLPLGVHRGLSNINIITALYTHHRHSRRARAAAVPRREVVSSPKTTRRELL